MKTVQLPRSLDELWLFLNWNPDALVYAGGTDLLVRLRNRSITPPALVCLERIEELGEIRDEGGEIFVGSCATHARLLADPLIRAECPILIQALQVLGSPQIRNMGTIGGNLVTASPAGDTLPPLYVLDADVEIRDEEGSRRIPVKNFIQGPGQTTLGPGEIVGGVRIPKAGRFNVHHYEKVGRRKALAIAVVSLAALMRVSDAGVIEEARLAWGSVGPTIVVSPATEDALCGRPLTRETMADAIPSVLQAVTPIDDIRASAEYRKTVAGNLLFRLLQYGRE